MNRPNMVGVSLFIAVALATPHIVWGQTDQEPESPSAIELKSREVSGSSFDWAGDGEYVDKDATTDGVMRIRDLENNAKSTIQRFLAERDNRQQFALPRDALWGEYKNLLARNQKARQAIAGAQTQIAQIHQTLALLPPEQRAGQNQRLADLEIFIRGQQNVIEQTGREGDRLTPRIEAYNNQIKPIQDHMQQLWNELEETRKQWLEIRDPTAKYARGDYEALRKVLDDWLLVDGLWPEAYFWAALCSYELQDYHKAIASLDKADRIRKEQLLIAQDWPEVLALRYLVGVKSPPHRGRTSDFMKKAERLNENHPSAFMYFLIANGFLNREQDHVRAKKQFEKALSLDNKYVCAEVALARLQTTSKNPSVADIDAGLQTLERVWTKTGQRSWRLASFLADAYDGAGQRQKAIELWNVILLSEASDTAKQQAKARITGTGSAVVGKGDKAPANSSPGKVPAQPAVAKSTKPTSETRNWKGSNGKEIQGTLKGIKITITRPDGTSFDASYDKLSEADKAYIREKLK